MTVTFPDYNGFMVILSEVLEDSAGTSLQFRDESLMKSAFARPENLEVYQADADLPDFAASLAFGIARNHPLVDGNKRAAALGLMTVLLLNGKRLDATQLEVVDVFQSLADGQLDELELAHWVRERLIEDLRYSDAR